MVKVPTPYATRPLFRWSAGASLWYGQHNAEYFGSYTDEAGDTIHELMMFDNM